MKYMVLYKNFDELNGNDFDEEVVNQYENITLTDAGLSCTVNGQEVITTIDNIIQDMREKQIELVFDAFAERVAKKMHEVLQQEPKCGKWVADRYCSECEWDKKEADFTSGWRGDYCPNCGARMECDEQ